MKGIEPAARLVDAFGDEVGSTAEIRSMEPAKAGLGIGHGAAVEPDVDKVGLPLHLLAAGAYEEDIVDIRTVEVDLVVVGLRHVIGVEALCTERILRHEAGLDSLVDFVVKLSYGADAKLFLAVFGTPHRQRSTPVAAAAEVPVLDVLEPFAETAGTGSFGLPLDALVELHHLLAHCRCLDEPAVERVVKHGLVRTPAVGIGVDMLLDAECFVLLLHVDAEVHVKGRRLGCGLRVVCVLDEAARPGLVELNIDAILDVLRVKVFEAHETTLGIDLRLRIAVAVGHIERRHAGLLGDTGVVGAEGSGYMDYARTFFGSDVVAEDDAEGTFAGVEPRQKLLVAHAFELFSANGTGEHLEGSLAVEPCGDEVLGEDVSGGNAGIGIGAANLHILDPGAYAQGAVAREGPGGSSPGEEVKLVFADHLELDAAGSVLDVAVAAGLVKLVGAEAGTGGGAVGLDGLALVEQALAVDILQKIPEGLDIAVVVGDVRIVHVDPVADALGKVAPLGGVLHNLLATGFVVLLYAYLGSYIFLGDAELFLNAKLDRQAVGVPAGTAAHLEAALRLIAADGVFDAAGHDVVDTGHAVGAGRAFEEDKLGSTLPEFERPLERLVLLPPFQHLGRSRHKVQTLIFFKCHFF